MPAVLQGLNMGLVDEHVPLTVTYARDDGPDG